MVIPIGKTNFRGQDRVFGIKPDDRRRHMYIIGKTGMGKTVLEQNMTIADIEAGNGLAVIDPHGEYAEELLDYIPSNRINDVIYFNPADLEFPIAFNAVEKVAPENRHLVASGLMSVFKKIWPDVWSARMEYILNNTILALLEYPNSTLLGIMRMLSNKEYRKKVIEKVTDPVIRSFWLDEYAQYNDKFEKEAIAPIQNKVGQFISAPIIRNIIGQVKSSIDMREIMDAGKILIINLSKGKIGEDNSKLLGGLLVTKLQLAAMSRVDVPESQRRDFYLYVDEFQNFATDSFADILSEARKYRLDLILAHQYIAQLSETVRDAAFGNVGTLVSFRVGAEDAEFLEREFAPDFTAQDLVNLAKTNIYIKLMIDGVASRPFSATTIPPRPKFIKGYRDAIIKISRERYAKNRKEVEEKISRWTIIGSSREQSKPAMSSMQGAPPPKRPPLGREGKFFAGGGVTNVRNERPQDEPRQFPKPKMQAFYKPFQRKDSETIRRVEEKQGVVEEEPRTREDKSDNLQKNISVNNTRELDSRKKESRQQAPLRNENTIRKPQISQNRPYNNPLPVSRPLPRIELNNRRQKSPPQSVQKPAISFPKQEFPVHNKQNVPLENQTKPISLKQAFLEKEAMTFSQRPIKKEVNRDNLKKLIEESLNSLEKEKTKESTPRPNSASPVPLVRTVVSPIAPHGESSTDLDNKLKPTILKPGEKIFFNQKKKNS